MLMAKKLVSYNQVHLDKYRQILVQFGFDEGRRNCCCYFVYLDSFILSFVTHYVRFVQVTVVNTVNATLDCPEKNMNMSYTCCVGSPFISLAKGLYHFYK